MVFSNEAYEKVFPRKDTSTGQTMATLPKQTEPVKPGNVLEAAETTEPEPEPEPDPEGAKDAD